MKIVLLFLPLFLSALFASCSRNQKTEAHEQVSANDSVEVKDTLFPAHGPRLLPVDEALMDTSLLNFRNNFLQAIYAKDEKYLLSVLDKNIKTSFGGDGGIEEFKNSWQANDYENFWLIMKRVLENGGSFFNDSFAHSSSKLIFMAPYIYSKWPDSLDAFEYYAVIKRDAPLHQEPNVNSKLLAELSYEIVKPDYSKTSKGTVLDYSMDQRVHLGEIWFYFSTIDGKLKGYMQEKNVYSPISYRALFGKRSGTWKMEALVAGD